MLYISFVKNETYQKGQFVQKDVCSPLNSQYNPKNTKKTHKQTNKNLTESN